MENLVVTFLGTSSATPTKHRGLPSIAIQREGDLVLMDCGEGMQRQVGNLGIGLNRSTVVLITHLHGDHVSGLLGLLQTMALAQRTAPVVIVAPRELLKWLGTTMKTLHIGLTFELRFVAARPGVVYKGKWCRILATRAKHSIEAYAYKVEEHERPGKFHPRRAIALGIPEGRLWSRLQQGKKVVFMGKSHIPSEVVGPRRPGRKIGYSGDTRPSSSLARFFKGVDLLIFDSTFSSKDSEKAVERKHSTSSEAAEMAKEASARMLVLTHFSARYKATVSLQREASRIFPDTIVARDGLRLEIPYPVG